MRKPKQVLYKGKVWTYTELSEKLGIKFGCLRRRIKSLIKEGKGADLHLYLADDEYWRKRKQDSIYITTYNIDGNKYTLASISKLLNTTKKVTTRRLCVLRRMRLDGNFKDMGEALRFLINVRPSKRFFHYKTYNVFFTEEEFKIIFNEEKQFIEDTKHNIFRTRLYKAMFSKFWEQVLNTYNIEKLQNINTYDERRVA